MDDSDCQIIDTAETDSANDTSVIILSDTVVDPVWKNSASDGERKPSPSRLGYLATGFMPFKPLPPQPQPQQQQQQAGGMRLEKKFELDDRSSRNPREHERQRDRSSRIAKPKKKKSKNKNHLSNTVFKHLAIEKLSINSDQLPRAKRSPEARNTGKATFNGQRYTRFDNADRNHQQHSPPNRDASNTRQNDSGAPRVEAAAEPLTAMQNMMASNKRFIVIDGSNVAVTHGIDVTHKKAFSCMGIKLTVDYFVQRGHTHIKALVPRFRRGVSDHQCPTLNPEILDQLEQKGYLTYTPSRFVNNKLVLPYDDRFILKTALHYNAVIVSNDNYRDLWNEDAKWKQLIHTNLLQYSFVNDLFLIADDPLGRNGPTIDQFLSIDYQNNNTAGNSR